MTGHQHLSLLFHLFNVAVAKSHSAWHGGPSLLVNTQEWKDKDGGRGWQLKQTEQIYFLATSALHSPDWDKVDLTRTLKFTVIPN